MGLVSYVLSYREIFLVAGALLLPLLVALSYLKSSDIHFETACAMPRRNGPGRLARGTRQSLWNNRALVIFALAVFLFQMANASMLPLAAGALTYTKSAKSSLVISALIVVPQIIVVLMAPWVGQQAKVWGRRPLLLAGFAALPVRALVFAWTDQPYILITAQMLDGISGAVLGVLTALTVADATAGTGRFNLAQGAVGTMSGLGASISTSLFGQIVGELWSDGGISDSRSAQHRRCTPPMAADARDRYDCQSADGSEARRSMTQAHEIVFLRCR